MHQRVRGAWQEAVVDEEVFLDGFETVLAAMTLSSNRLAFPSASTTYGCSVSLDGTNVTFLAASGTNLTVAAADRGRQVRVNVQFTPAGSPETYETWSTRHFGVPNANPGADPDGDGRERLLELRLLSVVRRHSRGSSLVSCPRL